MEQENLLTRITINANICHGKTNYQRLTVSGRKYAGIIGGRHEL